MPNKKKTVDQILNDAISGGASVTPSRVASSPSPSRTDSTPKKTTNNRGVLSDPAKAFVPKKDFNATATAGNLDNLLQRKRDLNKQKQIAKDEFTSLDSVFGAGPKQVTSKVPTSSQQKALDRQIDRAKKREAESFAQKYAQGNKDSVTSALNQLKSDKSAAGKREYDWLKNNQYYYWTEDQLKAGIKGNDKKAQDTRQNQLGQKSAWSNASLTPAQQAEQFLAQQKKTKSGRKASGDSAAMRRALEDITTGKELARMPEQLRNDVLENSGRWQFEASRKGKNNASGIAYRAESEQKLNDLKARLKKQGYNDEKVQYFLDYGKRLYNNEAMAQQAKTLQNAGFVEKAAASAASVPMALAGGVTGMADAALQRLSGKTNPFTGMRQGTDYNSAGQMLGNTAQAIRGTISADMSPEASFFYNTAMSMADFLAASATGPVGAQALLGGAAAQNAMQEAQRRGASDDQALLVGLTSGFAEALFERLSLGNLKAFKDSTKGARLTAKEIAEAMGKQGFVEGSEEVATTLANTLSDALIMADKSQINQDIERYKAEGLTDGEATRQAWKDWGVQLGLDYLGGMVSGGLVTGGTGAFNNAVGSRVAADQLNTEERVAVMKNALSMPRGSESRKLMDGIVDQMQKGKRVSSAKIGALYQAAQSDAEKGVQALPESESDYDVRATESGEPQLVRKMGPVAEALQQKGVTAAEAVKQASVINALLNGDEVANRQVKLQVASNQAAREVFFEITGAQLPDIESTSVPKMAEIIRAEAELYRANQRVAEAALAQESEALEETREAFEVAVEENAQQAEAAAQEIMDEAMDQTEAEQAAPESEPESQQANQPRETFEQFAERERAEAQSMFGWELSDEQLDQMWKAATANDGIRRDDGKTIPRDEFFDVLRQYIEHQKGMTPSDEQLEMSYQEWRVNSDKQPMSSDLWETMLQAAGRTDNAQEATGAETPAQAQEATGAEAQTEQLPEKPKTQKPRKPRQPKGQKQQAKKQQTQKPKTQKPKAAPAQQAPAEDGDGYWDSLLNETPPPPKDRRYSISVEESEAAKQQGIEADTDVSREQLLTMMYLKPFFNKKGIDVMQFADDDTLHGGRGVWDRSERRLLVNKNNSTAHQIITAIGHEIFHPATEQTRAESGKMDNSVAEGLISTLQSLADEGQLDGAIGTLLGNRMYQMDKLLRNYRQAYRKHYQSLGYSPELIKSRMDEALIREEFACDLMGEMINDPRILEKVAGARPDILTSIIRAAQSIRQSNPGILYTRGGAQYRDAEKQLNDITRRVSRALDRAARAHAHAATGAQGSEQYALPVMKVGSGSDTYYVNPTEVEASLQEATASGKTQDAAYFQSILDNDAKGLRAQLDQAARNSGFETIPLFHGVNRGLGMGGFTSKHVSANSENFFTTPQIRAGQGYATRRGSNLWENYKFGYDYPMAYRTMQSAQLLAQESGGTENPADVKDQKSLVQLANLIPGALHPLKYGSHLNYVSDEDKANQPARVAEETKDLYDKLASLRDAVESDELIAEDEDALDSIDTLMIFLDTVQEFGKGTEGYTLEEVRQMSAEASDALVVLDDMLESSGEELGAEAQAFFNTLNSEEAGTALDDALRTYDVVLDPEAGNIFSADYNNAITAEEVVKRLSAATERGVYQMYGRIGNNPMRFDAKNSRWRNLPFDEYVPTYLNDSDDVATDDLANWAKDNGHSALVIENVFDGAGTVGDEDALMTDYVFFNKDDVKSADLITFDEDGKIIPPSKRFSDEENWKYSINVPVRGLYNLSERVIENTKQNKLGAGSVINMLRGKGVKAEEIKWLGLDDFLRGKKSVTKDELLDYIRANDLVIEEETLRDDGTSDGSGYESPELYDTYTGELYSNAEDAYTTIFNWLVDHEGMPEDVVEERLRIDPGSEEVYWHDPDTGQDQDMAVHTTPSNYGEYDDYGGGKKGSTHWSEYSTPGGSDYRELLFRMPGSNYSNAASETHWEGRAPGVLAHARVQDFETADGDLVLFVDEIQSDWHNEGQRKGYQSEKTEEAIAERNVRSQEIEQELEAAADEYTDLLDQYDQAVYDTDQAMGTFAHRVLTKLQPFWGAMYTTIQRRNIQRFALSDTPANEIFVLANEQHGTQFDANDEYALNDLRELIQNRQTLRQALSQLQDRTDQLRKEHDALLDDERFSVPDAPFKTNYTDFVLKSLLRDAAEQDYDYLAWTTAQMQADRWSDDYMEGYRIEYDQDIPKFLNKFGKKFGAKVGWVELDSDGTTISVPALPITEEMRQSVLEDGLPKFALDLGLEDQIQAVHDHTLPRGHHVYFGTTTQMMKDIGFQNRDEPVLMSPTKMRILTLDKNPGDNGAHGITDEQLARIPYYLEHPVMVVDSSSNQTNSQGRPASENNVLFVTDMLDVDGFPIAVDVSAYDDATHKKWTDIGVTTATAHREKYDSNIKSAFGIGPLNTQMVDAVANGPGTTPNSGRSFEEFVRRAMRDDAILYISSDGINNLLQASKEWKQKKNQPDPGQSDPNRVRAADQTDSSAGSINPASAFVKRDWLNPPRTTFDNWVALPPNFNKLKKDVVLHKSRNIVGDPNKLAAQAAQAQAAPESNMTPMQLAMAKAFAAKQQEATNEAEPETTGAEGTVEEDPNQYAINVDVPEFDAYMQQMAEITARRNAQRAQAVFPTREQYDAQRTAPVAPGATGTGAASRGFVANRTYDNAEAYAAAVEKYGAMPPRPNLPTDLPVPRQTADDNRVSRTAQSAMNSRFVTPQMLKTLNTAVAQGKMSYAPITDQASAARAKATLTDKGWERALADWTTEVQSGRVTKDNVTQGLLMYNAALDAGDAQRAIEILVDLSENVRSGAQAVQAMSMLDKLTPEGRLMGLQRSVQNLEREIRDRLGDRAPDSLTIDPDLLQEYLDAQTDAEREEVMGRIYQNIADQIPATWADKFNNWRYMAMLANPRTHIRNMVGNAGFAPVRGVKNVVATGLEAAFVPKGKGQGRTKSIVLPGFLKTQADKARYQAALDEWAEVEPLIQSGGKFRGGNSNIWSEIRDRQTVYDKVKPAEWVRKKNSELLDKEDVLFSKPAYASSLAQYLKANGITAEQYNSPNFDKSAARAYAIKEAQKATYRDLNDFSDTISKLRIQNPKGKAGKAFNMLSEAVLPFKRTPANILVRGMEYSPVGLINGLKNAAVNVRNGKMTAAEAIDQIASGLTGTGLLALGMLLAKSGWLTGGAPDKDKEKAMEKLTGHQNYALEIGNKSYTLDWLAPEALPVFVGVELYKTMKDGLKGGDDLYKPIMSISEPILEMSMLQSLNDLIDSVSYKGDNKLMTMLASAATSYLTQYVPTLGGQIERVFETTQQRTYTDKNSPIPTDVQYAFAKAVNKTPGEYDQIEYVDEWGRTHDTGSLIQRVLTNFFSPGYYSKVNETDVDKMLKGLYEATGETTIYPTVAEKAITVGGEEHRLTKEQYVEFSKALGETRFDMLNDLLENKSFQDMNDADKTAAVKGVYEYAKGVAEQKIFPDKEVTGWITDASKAKSNFGLSPTEYILLYKQYGSDYLSGSKKQANAIEAYKGGVPLDKYLEVKSKKQQYDADGNDHYTNAEIIRAYTPDSLSTKQQQTLLSMELDESAMKKYNGARAAGISADTYAMIIEATTSKKMPANGVRGEHKRKVNEYLQGLVDQKVITPEQKAYLESLNLQ